jgi:hypothetical protein
MIRFEDAWGVFEKTNSGANLLERTELGEAGAVAVLDRRVAQWEKCGMKGERISPREYRFLPARLRHSLIAARLTAHEVAEWEAEEAEHADQG